MSPHNLQTPSTAPKTAPSTDWLKPAGTCFGVLLILAGLSLLWNRLGNRPVAMHDVDFNVYGLNYFWTFYYSGIKAHADFITGVVLLGGAAGLIGVAWRWFDPAPPEAAMKPGLFYGIGAALAGFITLFILRYGMNHIGGNDHSLLVDVGWRLCNGQTAYVDFPCTTPVAFVLGAKFAFQWFGVYWLSTIEMTALFAVLTFAWSLFLLAQLFGRSGTTLLWAMALHAISLMLASFWWYNPITDVAAVLYTLSAMYWLRRPAEKIAVASYGAALLLLATMKPNVAGVLIAGISPVLFASSRHRWKVIWVSLGSFALFLVLLSINNLSFTGMLAAYQSVARRGASVVQFMLGFNSFEKRVALVMLASLLLPSVLVLSQGRQTLLSPGSWIPALALLGGLGWFMTNLQQKRVGEAILFLPLFLALYQGRKSLRSPEPWIPAIALLGGLYGFITNSEQKLVDMPPVLCAAILLVAELRSPVSPAAGPVFQMPVWWNRYFALVCVVLGTGGLAQGFARDRVKSAGPVQFFEWDDSHTLTNGFFKGVHCGNILDEVIKEEEEAMRREPSSTVWFGPRMQWGYAAFAKPSPLRQPPIWDAGQTMYAQSKEEFYFNNFLQSRPQLVILFKNDISSYTHEEAQGMLRQYDVDQSFPLLTVLHLKK
jgi:hypothetical protein